MPKKETTSGASARRGGRKPGAWTHTTPKALREFRATHHMSRGRLAAILGVSSTSVQNWEAGKVASAKIQERLADIIENGVASAAPPPPRRSGPAASGADPVIATTGAIVAGYLQTRPAPVSQEELLSLIRGVRLALS
jgi:DNA-binding transcriptional regulator YiaG